jgi:hypothetical protein
MLRPSLLLVTLASVAAPDADAVAVRQDRPLAIWVEPELTLWAASRPFSH